VLAGLDAERAEEAQPLRLFARGLRQLDAPNLLTGAYAPGHRDAPVRRAWRVALLMGGVLLALAFAYAVLDWIVLRQRLDALDAAKVDVFKKTFPEATRIVDPVAQMRGELGRLAPARHGAGALPLLARVAPVLMQQPTTVTLQSIDYRNGVLEVAVLAPAVGALDALREGASALPGLNAELASATTTPNGAEGRLRIQERAP
jgi:general secretion pathway protein L